MDENFLGHKIGAWKLAGHFDGLYYALIDEKVDFDIQPSRYPKVTINRIKHIYSNQFIFENPVLKWVWNGKPA